MVGSTYWDDLEYVPQNHYPHNKLTAPEPETISKRGNSI